MCRGSSVDLADISFNILLASLFYRTGLSQPPMALSVVLQSQWEYHLNIASV